MNQLHWHPSKNELRFFSILLVPFSAIVYWFVNRHFEQPQIALVVALVFLGLGLLGLALPNAIRWFYVGWMVLVFPVGWLVSHTVLGFVYFLLITPIGFLRRLIGGDPLKRKIDPEAESYWEPLEKDHSKESYFRQS